MSMKHKLLLYNEYCDLFFLDKENQKTVLTGAKFRLHINRLVDKNTKTTLYDCIIEDMVFEMEAAGMYLEEHYNEIVLDK